MENTNKSPHNLKKLWHTLVVKKSIHDFVEFFRYFFVAVAAIGTDFTLLFILTHFAHIYYLHSAVISYLCGMCVNYFLSIHWVFATRKYKNTKREIIIFFAIGIIGLFVNEFLMWLFSDMLAIFYLISRIMSAGVGYIWKYIARKILLFK